jgi:dihydropyrimidinase
LIKGGEVVTAGRCSTGDIYVDGEKISRVGGDLEASPGDSVLDASGKLVIPGGIDVHTHFELPMMGTVSADDFASGSRAAITGGTTCFIDFAIPEREESPGQALDLRLKKAEGRVVADYGFHGGITRYDRRTAVEISELVDRGVSSFKCFLAYRDRYQLPDRELGEVMERVGDCGGMVSVHAESGDMVDRLTRRFLAQGRVTPEYHWRSHPALAEAEAVRKCVSLASSTGSSVYIVHLSSADGLAEVREGRASGCRIFAETCPQYLLLSSELYLQPGFEGAKYVMSPPLRPRNHQERLWQGLASGEIQTVATDHCPFNFKGQKDMGRSDFSRIPNGIGSVGERMYLLYSYGVGESRINLRRYVDVTATTPAKLFGMHPRKGDIVAGGDADLVVFDPQAEGVVSAADQQHNLDYTPYEGMSIRGGPEAVLLRGRFAVRDGSYVGEQGPGRYVRRGPSGRAC